MKTRLYLLLTGTIILIMMATLYIYHEIVDISDEPYITIPQQNPNHTIFKSDTVYVGVISRFSPNLIYEGYQPIMDYLSAATPCYFSLRLSNNYEQTISQLDRNEIQAAFLGTFLYLRARKNHPIRCILKPLNSQFQPYFHSVVITRTDSPISTVADLAGKRLALPSPLSFSGNWLLQSELKNHGLHASDLDSIHYFGFHHTVIYQVLRGNFDAGVVKDRVAEEFIHKGIRIIARSEPIPGSPIIVRKDLAPAIVNAIKEALLKIDIRKEEYQRLVKTWDPEFSFGFTRADDADYDRLAVLMPSLEAVP